eukprot:TRINITY_DN20979_c0_g1_i1.p2 TRINITY_DN20979_c0_g1~~TRINITY_DN20979_c0_g1_i1.p2  ORF type:complete len:117 (+),score=9.82 TRINITY_DN20979_c0_g1_i1:220-570(+)
MLDPCMEGDSWKQYYDLATAPGSWIAWSWRAWLTGNGTQEPSSEQTKNASPLLKSWAPYKDVNVLIVNSSFDIFFDENIRFHEALPWATYLKAPGCHCVYDPNCKKAIQQWFVQNA